MSRRLRPVASADPAAPSHAIPRYAVRLTSRLRDWTRVEVFQLPAPSTPHLTAPHRVAQLSGRNFILFAPTLVRLIREAHPKLPEPSSLTHQLDLPEDHALRVALLCRLIAPMRHPERTRACAAGVAAMTPEEAAYWFGMALYRFNPRRVLSALRMLLTSP